MPIFIRIVPTPTIFHGRTAERIPEGLTDRIRKSHESIYAKFAEMDKEKGIVSPSND